MTTKNTAKSKKPSAQAKAESLIKRIKKSKDMRDIHSFVHDQQWKAVGCASLTAAVKAFGLPSYSTMRRIYNSVAFLQSYLPEIEIGVLKKIVLRPIIEGKLSDAVKTRVAEKINNSNKPVHELSKRDIKLFIDAANSEMLLSREDKQAALGLAKKMVAALIIKSRLDEIKEYMAENLESEAQDSLFIKTIGRKFNTELRNQLGK